MHRRTARGNRGGLAVIGLVFLLAGLAVIGLNRAVYGTVDSATVVYPPRVHRYVSEHRSWLWPVVAVVAIVLGLLFLRWLLVQVRIDRLRRLRVDADQLPVGEAGSGQVGAGHTTLLATAVTDAIEDDAEALPGVRRVAAVLTGRSATPELWVRVTAESDADLALVHRMLVTETVPHARQALDQPDLPAHLQLVLRRRGRG